MLNASDSMYGFLFLNIDSSWHLGQHPVKILYNFVPFLKDKKLNSRYKYHAFGNKNIKFIVNTNFEEEYFLENGKEISRIYVQLDEKVNIHNKNHWQQVMTFFNEKMVAFEAFYFEYEDFIKA